MIRENGNAFANAYKCIKEQNELEAKKYQSALNEAAKKHQDTLDKIYSIRESREINRRNHTKLIEDCKNAALGTAIKAIYIEALVPGSLTDNALFLAENMVDEWIKESGGASKIISSCKNRTYLLNRICSIAEEVAMDDVKEIEADESDGKTLKEQEDEEAARKEKVTQMLAQANSLIAKATALQNGDESVLDNDDTAAPEEGEAEEKPAEDAGSEDTVDASEPVEEEQGEEEHLESDPDMGDIPEEEESKEEKKAEEEAPEEEKEAEKEEEPKEEEESEESESDDEEEEEDEEEVFDDVEGEDNEDENPEADPDMGDLDDAEEMEDAEEEDQQDAEEELTGESLDDDTVEEEDEDEVEDTSVDGENSEPQGKIFDELEKEEDVKKAVQLIQQRVADAEEDFIKRNAEDKKQIDDLLGKISDNIKTVEDLSNDESPAGDAKKKIAQESTMVLRRKIKSITENRPQSVFERMARKLTEGITKDSDVRAMYLAESGRADMASIVETTRVMYGFLEALRTLQLENVDAKYIENVLKEM